MSSKKIRVLIVDDSASVRTTLSEIISADPDLEVMATASDPYVAVERIRQEVPDVMFLDLEMPRMDGLTFLRKMMSQRPIPTVICSSMTEDGSDALMQALEAGAVEVVTKPRVDTAQWLQDSSMRICDAAKAAAHAKFKGVQKAAPPPLKVEAKLTADAVVPPLSAARLASVKLNMPVTDPIICIGASTGAPKRCAKCWKLCRPIRPACSSCSTCRKSSPMPLRAGSTAFAGSRSRKPKRATWCARAWY